MTHDKYSTEVVKNGAVIRKSRNLRGMRDYARISPVALLECYPMGSVCGKLVVTYKDGATCIASFNSYHVMIDFVRNRKSWKQAECIKHGLDIGYLTKPGIIAGGMEP